MNVFDFKFSPVASTRQLDERKRVTVETLLQIEEEPTPEPKPHEPTLNLSPALLNYLRLIDQTPDLKATERDTFACISAGTGTAYRRRLTTLGLIEEVEVRSGSRGRPSKSLRLTPTAENILKQI